MSAGRPLRLGGVEQRISLRGPAGAPLLLYLHGGPGVAELATMDLFAPPLTDRFRLVGWDQRGAGRSAGEPTLERLTRDLIDLVAFLRRTEDPPRIVLVGHSWGALLGLLALRREPRLADGLVAIGPVVAGAANEAASHRRMSRVARERGAEAIGALLRREPPPYGARGGASLRASAYAWLLGGLVRPRTRLIRAAAALAAFPGYRLRDKARFLPRAARAASLLGPAFERTDLVAAPLALEAPVLFCVGRHDLATPPERVRAAYDALRAPDKTWAAFDAGAHSVHYEAPDRFAAVVLDWYARTFEVPPSLREAVRGRVLRHGWNATAYQALAPGLEGWLAPDHDAAVGFVRRAGVRVAAGAPVAAAEDLAAVAAAFEADAREAGEGVCWFGAEARLAAALAGRPDHASVLVGAQPVWDPRGWPASVRRRRSVRGQLARARNKGVRIERWDRPGPARLERLRALQHAWLAGKGLPVLRFLTEPDLLGALEDRRLLVAVREGAPVAFLVASPVPARHGWLVEQLVRARNAPNGASELLVDAAMRAAAADGSRYLTLGLVPLARHPAASPADAPPRWLELAFGWARAHGRRFYDFAGLEAFKAKLAPDRWDPVYAIAAEPAFSPRTLWAIAGAFAGGPPALFLARALGRAARAELRGPLERFGR